MDERSPGAGRRLLAAGVLAAMVAALVYAAGRSPEPEVASAPEVAPAAGPGLQAALAPVPVPAPEPDPDAPAAGLPPAAPPPAEAPTFDVVRVSPDGSALVAGRAAPGAVVTVMADDRPLAEAEADAEGNFVAIFRAEPSGAPQALTLQSAEPAGATATSEDVVTLLPEALEARPEAPAGAGQAAQAKAPAEGVQAAPVEAAETAETATEQDEAAEAEAATVAATAILRPGTVEAAPVEAATGGAAAAGAASRDVTLASIGYAEQGDVTLAGVGTAGAMLRLYVDDAFNREAAVGADGRWSMALDDVAEGIYRLRIDQLAADGRVASRVETPFQRDYPRAPVPRPGGGPAGTVTVQPGNNLWTLARVHYGSGVHYTQIFTANRAQIRDPDLIYPGQIFAMPEMAAE